MGIRTVLKALVVCLGVTASYGAAARADMYTYTGGAYASCEGTFTCTGTAPQQTATFTFKDGAQLRNLPLTDVSADILSFSYNDGEGAPLTQISTISPILQIATDANGNVTSWILQALDLSFVGSDTLVRSLFSENIPGEFGDLSSASDRTMEGFGFSIVAGTWSKSSVTTPESGSGTMAVFAFIILSGFKWQRRNRLSA
jgi:hypothetical protein